MEVADGRNTGRHVVAGDHILGQDLLRDGSQADAHHPIEKRNQQHDTGSPLLQEAPEPKDDGALVLAQDSHRRCRRDQPEHHAHG